jgi:5-methylcytosine-specific restriction endonuclease McrA
MRKIKMNKKPVFKSYTLTEIVEFVERDESHEGEYRRGYRDGYIAATDAVFAIWFLGKKRAYNALFNFWKNELISWARFEIDRWLPPVCIVKCTYCGKQAHHLDHVHPKSKGGSDEESNLVPACYVCNCSKNDRTLEEWQNRIKRRMR